MLVWYVLLMHHMLPADSQDAQHQIISRAGDALRGDYFWRTAVEIVLGLELRDQLVVDSAGISLLRKLCMSCAVTTVNSAEAVGCSALSVVLLSGALRTATDYRWKTAVTLVEHIRQVVCASGLQAVEKLNATIVNHLQAMITFVAANHHLIRLELIPDLQYITMAMILAIHGSLKGFTYEIDRSFSPSEIDIPICPETVSDSQRSIVQQAEELLRVLKPPVPENVDGAPAAEGISSSDDTTALPVPVDQPPIQQDALIGSVASSDLEEHASDRENLPSKRTRSHTPSENEDSDGAKEPGGAEYWPQPSVETADNPRPQRRKRRKRARRRAMKDRLDTLLDGLEAELQGPMQGRGLGQLLQAQCRIAAIQRSLCDAALLLADPMKATSTDACTRHE
ncbi:hypothetical protein H4R20_005555 [Coemansia guatemalensis]|uniref:Uncharacterized protein n=1 Tax=Coemansia guatemalensis TaxID=2761395 RepID=A0A9W8LRQ7_9FUNG|nr:hypothetical protein H4R20_005555 [Coemansia guatemalensis]